MSCEISLMYFDGNTTGFANSSAYLITYMRSSSKNLDKIKPFGEKLAIFSTIPIIHGTRLGDKFPNLSECPRRKSVNLTMAFCKHWPTNYMIFKTIIDWFCPVNRDEKSSQMHDRGCWMIQLRAETCYAANESVTLLIEYHSRAPRTHDRRCYVASQWAYNQHVSYLIPFSLKETLTR